MNEKFTCKRCNHEFDMTDEKRKEFVKNGGCTIECPKCGSWELERTLDKRKLNDVYTTPCKPGYLSIYGIVGSGKTKETVLLKKYAPNGGTDRVAWNNRRGELWRVLEPLTEGD